MRLLFQFLKASIVFQMLAVGSKLGLFLFNNFLLLDITRWSLKGRREIRLMRDLGHDRFGSLKSFDERLLIGHCFYYFRCFPQRAGNRFGSLLVNLTQRNVFVLFAKLLSDFDREHRLVVGEACNDRSYRRLRRSRFGRHSY